MPRLEDLVISLTGFEWNAGNAGKNWANHRVAQAEAEEVFFNRPVLLAEDERHSKREQRYNAMGSTNAARLLSVIFTVRRDRIRVISARPMSRKERAAYAQVSNEEA